MKFAPLTATQSATGRTKYRDWDALTATTRYILARIDGWQAASQETATCAECGATFRVTSRNGKPHATRVCRRKKCKRMAGRISPEEERERSGR